MLYQKTKKHNFTQPWAHSSSALAAPFHSIAEWPIVLPPAERNCEQHRPRGPRGKVDRCVKARSEIRALTNPMDQQTIYKGDLVDTLNIS